LFKISPLNVEFHTYYLIQDLITFVMSLKKSKDEKSKDG